VQERFRTTKLSIFGLLILLFGAPCNAQQLDVRLHIVAASRQDAPPVRVAKLILWPDRPLPFNPTVVGVELENLSVKPVVSIELSSETTAPQGCTPHPRWFSVGSGPDANSVFIEPGATIQHWTAVANPDWIVSTTLWLKSRFVHAQVGVARVHFSDGTSWNRWEQQPTGQAFEPALLQADRSQCSEWQWPERLDTAIKKWSDAQAGWLRGVQRVDLFGESASGHAELKSETTASYFYDCTIQLAADVAHCGPPRILEELKQTHN
jgi:hypothetical protein